MKAYHQDVCARLVTNGYAHVGFETAYNMVQEGLLDASAPAPTTTYSQRLEAEHLTDLGRQVGTDRAKVLAARRVKANANSRARSEAMRSVGMKRTRNGGWE